jgi:hypothetical protein
MQSRYRGRLLQKKLTTCVWALKSALCKVRNNGIICSYGAAYTPRSNIIFWHDLWRSGLCAVF